MRTILRDVLTTVILAAIIFFGLRATIEHSVVVSPSMTPSLLVNQHLIINKIVYKFQEPRRGDVIVFHPPNGYKGDFIKRIIGLPGESVEIRNGTVYIHQNDGQVLALDEPYISSRAARPFNGQVIPENEYFVLGDNRNNSDDSRSGWTLPRQNIVGKAWISIWPRERWGLAPNYPLPQKSEDSVNSQYLTHRIPPFRQNEKILRPVSLSLPLIENYRRESEVVYG